MNGTMSGFAGLIFDRCPSAALGAVLDAAMQGDGRWRTALDEGFGGVLASSLRLHGELITKLESYQNASRASEVFEEFLAELSQDQLRALLDEKEINKKNTHLIRTSISRSVLPTSQGKLHLAFLTAWMKHGFTGELFRRVLQKQEKDVTKACITENGAFLRLARSQQFELPTAVLKTIAAHHHAQALITSITSFGYPIHDFRSPKIIGVASNEIAEFIIAMVWRAPRT